MAIKISAMILSDLSEVVEIEKAVNNGRGWSRDAFVQELSRDYAGYLVARDVPVNELLGYIGFWQVLNEGHITNLAVALGHQNKGIGNSLLQKIIELSVERKLSLLTLEVRSKNPVARRLYEKNGFKEVGMRKGYYPDNGDDALIMTLELTPELVSKQVK